MLRYVIIVLLTAAGVLALANLVVFAHARGAGLPPATTGPVTARQRWQELPAEDRLRLVEHYRTLVSREDAHSVLLHARQFVQLPPPQQELLRHLHTVLMETLDRQPAARRGDLLHYPPSAQAYFVYQALATEAPETLTELSQQMRATSQP